MLVRTIAGCGGDVLKFAGDALIVLWPAVFENLENLTRRAGQCAIEVQDTLYRTALADGIELSVKLGIGVGKCSIAYIGGVLGRMEYIAVGPSLIQAFESEKKATAGQTVLSPAAWNLVSRYFKVSAIDPDGYAYLSECKDLLRRVNVWKMMKKSENTLGSCSDNQVMISRIRNYIPGALVPFANPEEERWASERRFVTVLFVNLGFSNDEFVKISNGGAEPLDRLQKVMMAVQESVYLYEGSLNKFLMDDKGSTLITVFGLPPLAHEDDAIRAVLSALEICTRLIDFGLSPSIGITTGTAFCGIIGALSRREYSVLGAIVNLSARLMQHAIKSRGGILLDHCTRIACGDRLQFQKCKPISVKGLSKKVTVYQPYPRGVQLKNINGNTAQPSMIGTMSLRPAKAHSIFSSRKNVRKLKRDSSSFTQNFNFTLSRPLGSDGPAEMVKAVMSANVEKTNHSSFKGNASNFSTLLTSNCRNTLGLMMDNQIQYYCSHHKTNKRLDDSRLLRRKRQLKEGKYFQPGLIKKMLIAPRSALSTKQTSFLASSKQKSSGQRKLSRADSFVKELMVVRDDFELDQTRVVKRYSILVYFKIIDDNISSVKFEMCKGNTVKELKAMAVTMQQSRRVLGGHEKPESFELSIHGKAIPFLRDDMIVEDVCKLVFYYQQSTDVYEFDMNLVNYESDEENSFMKAFKVLTTSIVDLCTQIKGSMAICIGEAGIGKSHLINTVLLSEDWPIPVYGTAAIPFERNQPLRALKNVFLPMIDDQIERMMKSGYSRNTNVFRDPDTGKFFPLGSNESRQEYMKFKFPGECEAGLLSLFNDPFDLNFGYNIQTQILKFEEKIDLCEKMLIQVLYDALTQNPIIIFIDDAGFMDTHSWSFCHKVGERLKDEGLIFLLVTRPLTDMFYVAHPEPEIEKIFRKIVEDSSNNFIQLKPFPDEFIRKIACTWLKVIRVSDMLLSVLLSRSKGNPFICKELLRCLVENRYIKINKKLGIAEITGKFTDPESIPIPIGITRLVGSQIDRFDHVTMMILKVACVIGHDFDFKLIEKSYPVPEAHHMEKVISCFKKLLRNGIVEETGSFMAGHKKVAIYGFRNGFARNVLLSRLLTPQHEIIQKLVDLNKNRIIVASRKNRVDCKMPMEIIMKGQLRVKFEGKFLSRVENCEKIQQREWIQCSECYCVIDSSCVLFIYRNVDCVDLVMKLQLSVNVVVELIDEFEDGKETNFSDMIRLFENKHFKQDNIEVNEEDPSTIDSFQLNGAGSIYLMASSAQDLERWHLCIISVRRDSSIWQPLSKDSVDKLAATLFLNMSSTFQNLKFSSTLKNDVSNLAMFNSAISYKFNGNANTHRFSINDYQVSIPEKSGYLQLRKQHHGRSIQKWKKRYVYLLDDSLIISESEEHVDDWNEAACLNGASVYLYQGDQHMEYNDVFVLETDLWAKRNDVVTQKRVFVLSDFLEHKPLEWVRAIDSRIKMLKNRKIIPASTFPDLVASRKQFKRSQSNAIHHTAASQKSSSVKFTEECTLPTKTSPSIPLNSNSSALLSSTIYYKDSDEDDDLERTPTEIKVYSMSDLGDTGPVNECRSTRDFGLPKEVSNTLTRSIRDSNNLPEVTDFLERLDHSQSFEKKFYSLLVHLDSLNVVLSPDQTLHYVKLLRMQLRTSTKSTSSSFHCPDERILDVFYPRLNLEVSRMRTWSEITLLSSTVFSSKIGDSLSDWNFDILSLDNNVCIFF